MRKSAGGSHCGLVINVESVKMVSPLPRCPPWRRLYNLLRYSYVAITSLSKIRMPSKKSAAKPAPDRTDDAGSFELSLRELKKIVSELEGGELDLTGSLQRYEQGIGRLKECHEFLAAAEQRVSQLVGFDAEGNPVLQPVESANSEDLVEKQQARQRRRSAKTDLAGTNDAPERSAKARARESVDDNPELF